MVIDLRAEFGAPVSGPGIQRIVHDEDMLRSGKTFWKRQEKSLTAGMPFSLYPPQRAISFPISNRLMKAETVSDTLISEGFCVRIAMA